MTEWKSLKPIGYSNYEVSSKGDVRNVKRGKLIKPCIDKYGYYYVGLWNKGKRKYFRVHRLVAMTFIPNEGNLPEINHIDECKTNNDVSNLEWVTHEYNFEYSNLNSPVCKYDSEGNLLCRYWSMAEAARCNGISMQALFKYLNGHLVSNIYHGFIYRYEGQNPLEPIRNDKAIERNNERHREYNRKYYRQNKVQVLEQQRKYRQANREQRHEYYLANKEKWRLYQQKNKEKQREQMHERYLQKKSEQAQQKPASIHIETGKQ